MPGLPVIWHAIGMFVAGALIVEGIFLRIFSEEIGGRRARQSMERGLDYPRPGHIHPRTMGWMMLGLCALMLLNNFPYFLRFGGA